MHGIKLPNWASRNKTLTNISVASYGIYKLRVQSRKVTASALPEGMHVCILGQSSRVCIYAHTHKPTHMHICTRSTSRAVGVF